MAFSLSKEFGAEYVMQQMTYSDGVLWQQFQGWEALESEMNMPKAR